MGGVESKKVMTHSGKYLKDNWGGILGELDVVKKSNKLRGQLRKRMNVREKDEMLKSFKCRKTQRRL